MRCGGRLAASTGAFGGRSTVVTAPSVRRAGYTSGLVFTAGGHASGGGADPRGVYVETKNLGADSATGPSTSA